MLNWSDAAVLQRMQAGWRGGLPEGTPCGSGSSRRSTAAVRRQLPGILEDYGVRTVCEAGAGDMYWAKDVFRAVNYRPFDLVPRDPRVTALDITKERLPNCDLVVCRMVLIHLDPERVLKALALFRQVTSLLLASQFAGSNFFNPDATFNPTNLAEEPYSLGPPMEQIPDGGKGATLALWRLNEMSGL